MPWYKRLELWAKLALTFAASALLWRPGRRRPPGTPLPPPRKILLVRPDNRVGEALLTTPLLRTLKELTRPGAPPSVHVLVHAKVARALAGHPSLDALISFDRRRLWLGPLAPGIRALRRERYDVVVDCANWEAPSVTSAIVSRLAGPHAAVIGPQVWPVSLLHSISVPARVGTRREAVQRAHLLTPLTGGPIIDALSFREPNIGEGFRTYLRELQGPCAVLNPGGRLGERRIPPEAFAAAARALLTAGRLPIIAWGPGEELLAQTVAQGAPGALVAPATNLDELAALMRAAGLTVTNNTGPMHLSVAVGAPTLGLFLRMDMERWGHPSAPHRMVDLTSDVLSGPGLEARVFEEARAFALSLVEKTA
ncbi:glycosyltransferase family 9 protein [Stigmatella aurantiaca]|nr:glycosyltransferase family 9 protein [Stigmatella aurantiaca]